jgi:hypothetical protein
MDSKTDKEEGNCNDIALLSEIIADFKSWQDVNPKMPLVITTW